MSMENKEDGIQLDNLNNGHVDTESLTRVIKPERHLSEVVYDDDTESFDDWMSYFKANPEDQDTINHAYYHYNPLHVAVFTNNVEILKKLIDANADPHCQTSDEAKHPPLVLAASKLPKIQFENDDTDFGIPTSGGTELKTTFHVLLQNVTDVNASNHHGVTALHAACSRGIVSMATHLLNVDGIKLDQRDNHGNMPVHAACDGGNTDIVTKLIECGADFKQKNDEGKNPLHVAVVEEHIEVVKTILDSDKLKRIKTYFLQEVDHNNECAFLLAVKTGNEGIVKVLLDTGFIKLTNRNHVGANAFHLAAAIDKVAIMELIFGHDKPKALHLLTAKDFGKCTPLHDAAIYDQVNALNYMVKRSKALERKMVTPLLEQKMFNEATPLLAAVACGSLKTAQVLIESGTDLTATTWDGENVVHLTADCGAVDLFKMLLDKKISKKLLNAKKGSGDTPLHIACYRGHHEMVEELLRNGAKIRIMNNRGHVPLHIATIYGHLEIVQLLVKHDPKIVDIRDEKYARTSLTHAAEYGHEEIAEYLLRSKADVNGLKTLDTITDDWNITPLLIACIRGHVKVVELLLTHGADVTCQDCTVDEHGAITKYYNCLAIAITKNHKDVALAIVKSKHWENAMRWRAEDDKYGHDTPMKLLIKHMPDVAKVVLENCIKKDKKEGTLTVTYEYEFLDDVEDKIPTATENDQKDSDDKTGEKKKQNWTAKDFKKDAHALQIMVDSKRTELLNHPLATKLLSYKWKTVGLHLYLINLLTYMIFLSFLTAFALTSPTPRSIECISTEYAENIQNCSLSTNSSCTASDNTDCKENYNRLFLRSAAVIIILFSFIRICIEITQVYYRRKAYFYSPDNWVEACLFTSSIVFVSYGLQSGCQCPASWHWQFGAFTLLIAWLDLVLFLKNFPQTGVYVLMIMDILHTFLKMFLISTLFVISFGLTFYMLFHRPGIRSAFSSPARSLIKTLIMTVGEFEFDGIFFNSQEDADAENNLFYPQITYFLWIVFVILMPIILTNLLIGLAVDDIKGIQDNADLKRLALMVDFTLHVEESFFFKWLCKWQRLYNWLNPKPPSETVKYKKEDCAQFLKLENNQIQDLHNDSPWQKIKKYFFELSTDQNLNDDLQTMTTAEQIKEEVAQLKKMNEKAKADQAKNLSKVKAMIADANHEAKAEISELKNMVAMQSTILQSLIKICSKPDDAVGSPSDDFHLRMLSSSNTGDDEVDS